MPKKIIIIEKEFFKMTVEFFNLPYFVFLFFGIGITVLLHFVLKNKSLKTKKLVIFGLLVFNFALHFLKLLFYPYNQSLQIGLRDVFAINICAVSVLVFPFIFISKSDAAKDFMFYLGVLSGTLALLIPTEALGETIWQFDLFRFYIAHTILLVAPFLMVSLGVHKLDYKRIWKMPLYIAVYFMFIMVNQVLQSELGIIDPRNADFLNINFKNTSFFWKKSDDALFVFFDIFTPKIFKTVPFGPYAGQTKYWPLIWIMPAATVYFIILPLLICLPWQARHIKTDIKNVYSKTKNLFSKNKN